MSLRSVLQALMFPLQLPTTMSSTGDLLARLLVTIAQCYTDCIPQNDQELQAFVLNLWKDMFVKQQGKTPSCKTIVQHRKAELLYHAQDFVVYYFWSIHV